MSTLLQRYGLSLSDATAIASVVVAVVLACIPHIRRVTARVVSGLIVRAGLPSVRYRRWFLGEYRNIFNVYLDSFEEMSLADTYVPLTVMDTGLGGTSPVLKPSRASDLQAEGKSNPLVRDGGVLASHVMGDAIISSMIIAGDPGTGKSTLLKAFGVGTFRRSRTLRTPLIGAGKGREVPVLVPLRRFALNIDTIPDLEQYIVEKILRREARLGRFAAPFLRRILKQRRLLVLLDGLDEVASSAYPKVRAALHEFKQAHSRGVTHHARIVLTCRQQNLNIVHDDWIPSFAEHHYRLAPFRDSEILAYARRVRDRFKVPARTPESFFDAVMASGTADFHRVPLILAMSAGIYSRRSDFEIPPSVSLLYEEVLKDLLNRRDFRLEPATQTNAYSVEAKMRFLRDFAAETAVHAGRFDDFARSAMIKLAREMAGDLVGVRQAEAEYFVDEIILKSGMIIESGGSYAFAHRSMYEYLVADHMRLDRKRARIVLIEKCVDPDWRQTCIFFVSSDGAGAPGADELGGFVAAVAERNLDLAGYCLGSAPVPIRIARPILDKIRVKAGNVRGTVRYLPALVRATRSPDRLTSAYALKVVENVLGQLSKEGASISAVAGDVAPLIDIADALVSGGSADVLGLVPSVVEFVPDDPRLVGLLWRCLASPSLESLPKACAAVVRRLLLLASNVDCFQELQAQARPLSNVEPLSARAKAFPFKKGVAVDTNLVSLIAFADKLAATGQSPDPYPQSAFFQAKRDRPDEFARLEREKRMTVKVALNRVPRVALVGGPIVAAAVALLALIVFRRPWQDGASSLTAGVGLMGWAYLTLPIMAAVLLWLFQTALKVRPLEPSDDASAWAGCLSLLLPPLLYGFALLPLATRSMLVFIAVSVAVTYALSVLPLTKLASNLKAIYIPPLNPLLHLYDDSACAHWINRETTERRRQGPAALPRQRSASSTESRVVS